MRTARLKRVLERLNFRRGGPAAAAAVGLAAGLLVAAVAVPGRQQVVVETQGGRARDGSGPSSLDSYGELYAEPGTASPQDAGVSGAAAGAAGGRTVTSGRGGSGGGAGGPSAGASATTAAGGRGITDTTVKIGVAIPDITALKALGPRYDNGDPQQQFEALLDRWKREKVVPVAGRTIEFAFRKYNALSPADQRAACTGLVQDDKVFAVIGITYYYVGSECVAREFRTPLLTSDGPTDEVFARSHPFLFSIGMSESRLVRNWMHWAHHRGLLRGKTIGVYYLNDAVEPGLVAKDMKPELARNGYRIAVEATTNDALGGPSDAIAVQRFRSAGVDLAILLTSRPGFMQQSEAQGYKPTYIESDHAFGTSDTTTSNYNVDQWDGTFGMTGRRVGETAAGIPVTVEGRACLTNYERYAGKKLTEETAEWAYVLTSCDEGKVLIHGLDVAGRGLNAQSFVAALETIHDMPMNRYATASFSPTKHHGGEFQRTVRWFRSCACWKAQGEFGLLWVQ